MSLAGEDVLLACQVGGDPQPDVQWRRQGVNFTNMLLTFFFVQNFFAFVTTQVLFKKIRSSIQFGESLFSNKMFQKCL